MKVFADMHHADLAHSLKLLFDRLGGELYFPIGMEWAQEGWWHLHQPYNYAEGTAKQYLDIKPEHKLVGDHYEATELHNGYTQKFVTVEQFKSMDIDIVIASLPQHIKPFKKLILNYKPNAKFIFQMGNMFLEVMNNLYEIPNLLSSTISFPTPCHSVFYHQEFDLNIFKPSQNPPEKLISSFINVYPNNSGYIDYCALKAELPEFDFKSYGASCDNGVINTTTELAYMMQRSAFGFHSKWGGDGYGHILYNLFACGKPVITRISDYKGKLGEELLTEDTCLDIDNLGYNGVVLNIREMSPEQYLYMVQQAYAKFQEKVNFNQESINIKKFMEELV